VTYTGKIKENELLFRNNSPYFVSFFVDKRYYRDTKLKIFKKNSKNLMKKVIFSKIWKDSGFNDIIK
jgi:hypothetical protein